MYNPSLIIAMHYYTSVCREFGCIITCLTEKPNLKSKKQTRSLSHICYKMA